MAESAPAVESIQAIQRFVLTTLFQLLWIAPRITSNDECRCWQQAASTRNPRATLIVRRWAIVPYVARHLATRRDGTAGMADGRYEEVSQLGLVCCRRRVRDEIEITLVAQRDGRHGRISTPQRLIVWQTTKHILTCAANQEILKTPIPHNDKTDGGGGKTHTCMDSQKMRCILIPGRMSGHQQNQDHMRGAPDAWLHSKYEQLGRTG